MILRRIAQHMKQQHWTGVFIELVIVILGVFIGLQVSNWNEAREAARKGVGFSRRLTADMRVEAWSYEVTIDYLNSVKTNIDHALKALDGETNASDEQLLVYAFRATQYAGVGVTRRATFDELTSTGSLGLIADKKLLNTAMLLYNSGVLEGAMTEGISSAYRIEFRKMLSVDVQVALNEHCGDKFVPIGDYSVIGHQLNYACKTGLQPAQIEKAANVLRTDPEFVALLRLRAMNVRGQLSNLSVSNQDLRESLRTVAGPRP